MFYFHILPEADPETRIQVEVVYLGDDPSKNWYESEQSKLGNGGKPVQNSSHCAELEINSRSQHRMHVSESPHPKGEGVFIH